LNRTPGANRRSLGSFPEEARKKLRTTSEAMFSRRSGAGWASPGAVGRRREWTAQACLASFLRPPRRFSGFVLNISRCHLRATAARTRNVLPRVHVQLGCRRLIESCASPGQPSRIEWFARDWLILHQKTAPDQSVKPAPCSSSPAWRLLDSDATANRVQD